MTTFVTSDPEGFNIFNMTDFNPDSGDSLIICGDILDSTFVSKSKDDILNDDILNAKSFNLSNIKNILLHDNINLVFGNRDLNKIKCKYLCKLNNLHP
jgi:hypothetical protein